eukprot:gnl/TRDRNA2_/TRDRNA2_154330_c0_seq1.p3 gnl/TRDRNA2_/TRDRNA2_154330_c0~~gnl/TRDRNA2_/TRDRNA2_154330_c0_seq1.p3  ORF type:complete len:129 (-),score=11.55 gnl/TRDRNA2_/TRDRNA2_154330_c0_seq1:5-391(-)
MFGGLAALHLRQTCRGQWIASAELQGVRGVIATAAPTSRRPQAASSGQQAAGKNRNGGPGQHAAGTERPAAGNRQRGAGGGPGVAAAGCGRTGSEGSRRRGRCERPVSAGNGRNRQIASMELVDSSRK